MTTATHGGAAPRPATTDHGQKAVLSCRLCGSSRMSTFIDLGATPPCERFLAAHELDAPEPNYPLHVRICEECLLAQLPALITPEGTFTEYAYFSSFSTSWVTYAESFVADAVLQLGLDAESSHSDILRRTRAPSALSTTPTVAMMLGASRPTVDKWLKRYEEFGMEGLVNKMSPGGRCQIPDRIRGKVLALTRTTPPSALGVSHWSLTEMALYIKKTEGVYVSQTWVSALWRAHGLTPWRQGTFKISKDPRFEYKVRATSSVCTWTLRRGRSSCRWTPSWVSRRSNRTQPLGPIDFGKTQKRTHDYARMETTDLYAAIDVRTGKVIASLSPTHATPDFLRLMNKVVAAYPAQKVHVVLDNASAHRSKDTDKWLAKQQGQVVFHFTPHRRVVDEPDRDLERYHHPEGDPV